MRYYRLVKNSHNYGYFQKDKIYPENIMTDGGYPLSNCINDNPDDWEEVSKFLFGRGYLYDKIKVFDATKPFGAI